MGPNNFTNLVRYSREFIITAIVITEFPYVRLRDLVDESCLNALYTDHQISFLNSCLNYNYFHARSLGHFKNKDKNVKYQVNFRLSPSLTMMAVSLVV